jgi:hypothetical protein
MLINTLITQFRMASYKIYCDFVNNNVIVFVLVYKCIRYYIKKYKNYIINLKTK